MKASIPLGMLLLIAAAAAFHRSPPPQAAGVERRVQVRSPGITLEASPAPLAVPSPVIPTVAAPEPKKPSAPSLEGKAAPGPSGRMTSLLARELSLTALQRDAVEQLLKDRDAEIKACHAAIVRSGVIDLVQYDWQVRQMKEGWFLKVDTLLDRVQHDRFLVLVQQGFFNEGLAFTVQPGMTVLD